MRTLFRFNMLCAVLAAAFMVAMAPAQRAEALSLVSPGAATTAKFASEGFTTEVRGRRGGGGRGFGRGGGRRFGGFNRGFRRGGFGYRRNFGYRRGFYRPRFYGPRYYGYRRCRIVLTSYGPRRICRPRRFF